MRLDWLESFLAFAETRNFTRAAERLHLSQPALHVQVKRLAQSLGVPLYHRRGRELVLTDQGQSVAAFARDVLARTRGFSERLRSGTDDSPAILCAGRGTHLYMLSDGLRRWVRGGGRLSLLSGDRDETVDAVLSGRAHLGIAPLDDPPPELRARPFRRVGQCAVVPTDHPLAERRRLALSTLARYPLILPSADRPHRLAVATALRAVGADPRIAVEAGGWELMMHYASLGLGVAVVNDICRPPAGTRAIAVPALPVLDYRLFVREGGYLPPSAEDLHRHLTAERARTRGRRAR